MIKKIRSVKSLRGRPLIPGDKSISHRALILGALAHGKTEIIKPLESEDVHSTTRCLRDLGVLISQNGSTIRVEGIGNGNFKTPSQPIDCGNSGTTMRLMMGVLAGKGVRATLTGDSSLIKRPMKRVTAPLELMGAKFQLTNENFAPLTIGGGPLCAVEYDLKIASAQIKSAIMLAALSAKGVTKITGQIHSRDHSERMLRHFGVPIEETSKHIMIEGGIPLKGTTVNVPGDPSTAAFWIGAATIVPGSVIELENISLNHTRTGFIRALKKMGANVTMQITSELPEPVGTIKVESSSLIGIMLNEEEIPSLIDELPLLAVIASQAKGVTEVSGAKELRVKETDRIKAIAINLKKMGIKIEIKEDGFKIEGPQKLKGAVVESFNDHRIAMSFSIAGLIASGETEIHDAECVSISYPAFYETLEGLIL